MLQHAAARAPDCPRGAATKITIEMARYGTLWGAEKWAQTFGQACDWGSTEWVAWGPIVIHLDSGPIAVAVLSVCGRVEYPARSVFSLA